MGSPATGLTIRRAEVEDIPALARLERLAFCPQQATEPIEQQLREDPEALEGQWLAVAADGRAVGAYKLLDLNTVLEGQILPLGGLAGVAVSPEARGRGVARGLVRHALAELHSQKVPLAMLYPFQHGFYRQLGWAWVGRLHQYTVATDSLPKGSERTGVVPCEWAKHGPELCELYQRAALRHNGWLVRQERQWQQFAKPHLGREIFCYFEQGRLLGYLVVQYQPDGPPTGSRLLVREWVAVSREAYWGLLGFLSAMRDQIKAVMWTTYPEDLFPYLLREQRRVEKETLFGLTPRFGEIGGGFMWRLVDVQEAFRLRVINQGPPFMLTFEIQDPELGEQVVTANFTAGRMHPVTRPEPAVLRLSIDHLVELFCGLRKASELAWTRELEFTGERSLLAQLDRAWQCTPPFCWNEF
ncbi:enhanced intracellular survival protein Eis [Leptolyngbya sp. FACHB-261]|uniref:GNAT family N-acetyltransferase n=1 Tax=Leptolyngbya sp. FACHB-261 TaxID=2692806 RepID=UPI001684A8E0|nr:GNAT family N-acetyltransferase [Leptolyngbya sp. FACHB-261]MBD2104620.1 GNAT family N-acetyltransferase [Leptolyngbya sp. FACHB-261]